VYLATHLRVSCLISLIEELTDNLLEL
jgi:hypothetical protein